MRTNARKTEVAGQTLFSLGSVAAQQAPLVEELARALRSGVRADDATPFVSSGTSKKFGMQGNAGISRF